MKKTAAFVVLCLLAGASAFGQYAYFYGKNKVVRQAFPWKYVDTKNFRIFYYTSDMEIVNRLVTEAENSYLKLSTFLNVTIEKKTPLIYYEKQTDLEQTNLYPGIIAPGSFEGFTESNNNRVVIYGNRTSEELGRLITHELSHSFQNAILYKKSSRGMFDFNQPPLWVMEGHAEFMTGYWDSFALLTVIDSVLNDRMPEIQEDGDIRSAYGNNRLPYDFGHLIYDFMFERFGRQGIRDLLTGMRRPKMTGKRRSFLDQFDFTAKTFNYEFKKYARERFKAFFGRENPEDYSFLIGPDFPFAYSFSHQVSPGGELLAVVTVNYRTYKLEIIMISLKDGKVIKNVTPGFQSTYDGIEFKFVPSDGRTFSWDRQGENIAFFVRQELDSYLMVLNALDNRVVKRYSIGAIQKASSPVFDPLREQIYFTGLEGLQSFIFTLDLATGKIRKLSDGRLFIKAVDVSADGRKLVYSAGRDDFDKLYLADATSPDQATRLTHGKFNDIAPAFSTDGKTVYYSSDELGAYNICALDLESRTFYRYSDVRSGNFFPVPIPGEASQLVISSYHKGSFLLFKKSTDGFLEKRSMEFVPAAPAVTVAATAHAPAQAEPPAPLFTLAPKKYKPFEKLLITSLPPIEVAIDSSGGFYGASYLGVSDMLGDHNFVFYLSSFYGYRSYHLTYVNRQRRMQYYLHLFSEGDAYYLSYNYNDYFSIRSRIGGQVGVVYPFNRSTRAELSLAVFHQREDSDLFFYGYELPYGQFFNGMALPLEAALILETTRFANYGPNMGQTFMLSVKKYFKLLPDSMDAISLEGDYRKYLRLGNQTLFAFRLSGFYSGGKNSLLFWSGGNNSLRGEGFRSLIGNKGFFFNAEFRFPLVTAALTPIGILGPIRGVFFFDIGGLWFNGQTFDFFEDGHGIQLKDGLASFGYGIQFFFFGYPMHLEWVYKTNFKETNSKGIHFWIGFDY
jgi:hypothetical protein